MTAPVQYGFLVLVLMNVATQGTKKKKNNLHLTFSSLLRNRKIAKTWKSRINRTDLPKMIVLCEEHLGESCLNKSVNFERRLMNSKD